MSALYRLASLIRNLFHRSRVEREMDAELSSFVQMLADENTRAGMSPEAARRAARVEVQGVEQVKEEVRGVLAGAPLESVVRDVRFGVRMLLKHPVLSLSVILTFGLGIGLTTTVFGLFEGVFLAGLPFEGAERIMALGSFDPAHDGRFVNYVNVRDFLDLREQQTVFEGLAAYAASRVNITEGDGEPERYAAGLFSPGAFEQLNVRPMLGRTFRRGEDMPGADPVMVLGYDLWRERFGGSRDVLGRELRVHGTIRTIVGVMPEGFAFPRRERLWLPLTTDPSGEWRADGPRYRVIGRLREGTSSDEARAQVATLAARLERPRAGSDRAPAISTQPFMEAEMAGTIPPAFLAMLGAAFGVLLIACANVTNLLLAHSAARSREVTIRTALGASRGRVARQLVIEVLILAGVGTPLGLGLAASGLSWVTAALAAGEGENVPFWMTFGLDWLVLLFAAGVTLLAGVASSLVPAMRAANADVTGVLKDGGRGLSSLRMGSFSSALVVAEVAVSCALLVVSGLVIQSVVRLNTVNWSFATKDIFTAAVALPRLDYPDSAARAAFHERLLPRLAAIPGVEAVTLAEQLPALGVGRTVLEVQGRSYARDSDYPRSWFAAVGPGYFETFQARVLQGREFAAGDRKGTLPVALVNESFARRHFPGGDPLGRHIRLGRRDTTVQWLTVVGVVPDMCMQGVYDPTGDPAGFYVPIAQSGSSGFVNLVLRTRGEPMALTPDVRAAVKSLDPNLPISDVRSMESSLRRATWYYRDMGGIFVVFGFAALFLASVGLYGVMSFAVTRRTHEMGVRMALGADGSQLVWLVLRKGVVLLAIGLAIGLAIAALAAGTLVVALFGVQPRDPVVFGAVVASLALVGLAATLVPAHRVTRVNPVVALGAE